MKRLVSLIWLWLAALAMVAPPAAAHDPFDGNIQLFVYPDKIEAKVTLGYDASREFLRGAGLPPQDRARLRHPAPDAPPPRLPSALAERLLVLDHEGKSIAASAMFGVTGDTESNFLAIYPRPAKGRISLRAAYLADIEYMRPGMLVVADERHRTLFSKLLTPAEPSADIPLGGMAESETGFGSWFKLGVHHILEGYDHLLFLCALLMGMRSIRQMLVIITCFTISHSVTLALSALKLVSINPAIVEPVIAGSIAVACLVNLFRKEAARTGYWMAGAFGLIHGFGFAGALMESGLGRNGTSIIMPLLAFNLGVESGQLMVAALVIPVLFALRSQPRLARYGVPALSLAMTAASFYWIYRLELG